MRYSLLSAFGIELEYMIVDAQSLSVKPIADRLIFEMTGSYENEVERGVIDWSNELARHVLEFKNPVPVANVEELPEAFQAEINTAQQKLEQWGARLMPSAMHPWMDPLTETELWPHGQQEIYKAYDKVFGCQGHGWSNLQSTHINVAFDGDQEMRQLHAAIRLVLPLIPAWAASSPYVEGKDGPGLDSRLWYYSQNQRRIPSIIGDLIPEAVWSKKDYEDQILKPMYKDIAPQDPQSLLQHEWLNSRAAIARFERNAFEIRCMDIQECAVADLALVWLITETLRGLCSQQISEWALQAQVETLSLKTHFLNAIRDGEQVVIEDADYLRALGLSAAKATGQEIGHHLLQKIGKNSTRLQAVAEQIISAGTLASRIQKSCGRQPHPQKLRETFARLCNCLSQGELFES